MPRGPLLRAEGERLRRQALVPYCLHFTSLPLPDVPPAPRSIPSSISPSSWPACPLRPIKKRLGLPASTIYTNKKSHQKRRDFYLQDVGTFYYWRLLTPTNLLPTTSNFYSLHSGVSVHAASPAKISPPPISPLLTKANTATQANANAVHPTIAPITLGAQMQSAIKTKSASMPSSMSSSYPSVHRD